MELFHYIQVLNSTWKNCPIDHSYTHGEEVIGINNLLQIILGYYEHVVIPK